MVVATESTTARAGLGCSVERAVNDAVEQAMLDAQSSLHGADVRAALVFATVGYDQQAVLDEVAGRLEQGTVVVGCSGEGIIAFGESYERPHALTIVLFAGERLGFHPVFSSDFGTDSVSSGHAIADQVQAIPEAKVLLLFPDGITGNATAMLDVVGTRLPEVIVSGGAAGDMFAFEKTYQYAEGRAHCNAVSGLVISGPVQASVNVNHGCRPIGRERVITGSDGVAVSEIDDQPAWEVFQEYLGERDQLDAMDIVHLCLGRPVRGDPEEAYGRYVIRMPLGQDDDGVVRFPGGLEQGTSVRMTRRDPGRIAKATADGAQALAAQAPDAFLVLQFDCAGRGLILFGDRSSASIAAPVRDAFDERIPVVGLHTFGEIAPLGGRLEYHNYTVALLALTEVS